MFGKTMVRFLLAAALAATLLGGTAMATYIPPTGLAPGSKYQIAFVTSGSTTVTSTNIADYNTFVTQQAALSSTLPQGVTWRVIGSTPTTNAINNAPTYAAVPIYNTAGQLVASGSAGLWSGSILNPVEYDENGNSFFYQVWTGTGTNGTADGPLGEFPPDEATPGLYVSPDRAYSGYTNFGWIDDGPVASTLSYLETEKFPMYALSSPITVPEPASLTLLGTALLGLWVLYLRRRGAKAVVRFLLAAALASAGVSAQADVFNMPSGQTSVQFVSVGDPNNPPDPATGYGAVPYVYQMGKYDVTVGQYCQFLNAVAKTDPYGLYNSYMSTDYSTIKINQSGSPGNYSYAVTGGYSQAANCPIFDVTWGDAARFCNWLDNGQPTAPEGNGITETGAYTLSGDTTNLTTESRNAGAKYFIPTENEWYKAAYFDPANGSYWTYPTQSNSTPSNSLGSAATSNNDANFWNSGYSDTTNYLTPVGEFEETTSPFGAYDMGGDINQWNETLININGANQAYRNVLGGSWNFTSYGLTSSSSGTNGIYGSSTNEDYYIGFRVASTPEPTSIALLLAGGFCLLAYAWRRRRQA